MYFSDYESPVGRLLIAASDVGLSGIYFPRHRHFKGIEGWEYDASRSIFQNCSAQLTDYFNGSLQQFNLPLDLSCGTAFQQRVWKILSQIGYAQTVSYATVAMRLGQATAARAVGTANGRNPLSIIIPCHRVIATSGALTGYAGGVENKQYLLNLEQKYQSQSHL